MASRESIRKEVVEVIINSLGLSVEEECTDNADLRHDLGCDSLDLIELTMELEEKYGISIPDADADKLTTVGHVIDYITKHSR